MGFLLTESQFQKLESIFNDLDNSRGSDYNATSICQLSDVVFAESEEPASNQCSCRPRGNNGSSGDDQGAAADAGGGIPGFRPCQERALLIKAGFSACIRAFTYEGFASHVTNARVIRILRRLLKGVSPISIDCVLHREMLQGFGVIFGMIPDYNALRVLQSSLKSYLFWCYTQSDDEFIVNNSRMLLCVTTWMRETTNNTSGTGSGLANSYNEAGNNPKYGLTLSSQELLTFLMSDLGTCTEQFQRESRHNLSDPGSSNLELRRRILRNLQLFSVMIVYSGVYHPPGPNPSSHSSMASPCSALSGRHGGSDGACKQGTGSLITTLITPQIMQVLGNLRVVLLEEVFRFVDEFITVYLESGAEDEYLDESPKNGVKTGPGGELGTPSGDKEQTKLPRGIEIRVLNSLMYFIFAVLEGNCSLKSREDLGSFLIKGGDRLPAALEHILALASLQQEIFENLLKASGKTGLVVYSHMIQEYLISVFSWEHVPSASYKFRNAQTAQLLFDRYYSSVLFGFGLIPETRLQEFDYQIFLSFRASLKIVEYFDRLFQEMASIQDLSLELLGSNSISRKGLQRPTQLFAFKDALVTRLIGQRLASQISICNLANRVILDQRYTRVGREFRQKDSLPSIDRIINKYHVSSSVVVSNIITRNCQPFNLRPLKVHELLHSDLHIRKVLLEITYLVCHTIMEYYQDAETTQNPAVFNNILQTLKGLLFILDDRLPDERLEAALSFFTERTHSKHPPKDGDNHTDGLRNPMLIHSTVYDFSKKDQFYLDYKDEDFDIKPETSCPHEDTAVISIPLLSQSPPLPLLQSEEEPEKEESLREKSPDLDEVELCMNLTASSSSSGGEEEAEPSDFEMSFSV
ncbi:mucin-like protein [Cryptosporidium canis]|uniref:Mucin-like protein n=1 Tax=Cryptosporidium canis TaxID=195482 RepID=A0A9D5DGA4_9CRYT|nr:mucin-like protein [Cryptosporidium canis]